MPLLAGLLTSLFGSVASFFATWMSAKAAAGAAALVAFAALTATFVAAAATGINAAAAAGAIPSTIAQGMALFMPSNIVSCLGSLIGARIAATVYQANLVALKLVVTA